ncbi:putative aminopeptidase W07G4.4 [Neocloeon triangulifer]|uniref:putative aminopeptidase W07G4.4 n=1 Tax=Neocloeon triangulifer TaxID=2078957 RepID=UPI00286EF40F|nr:putative aminopeptidase W07G4.4 [Neocloeon triangulifer]
MKPDTLPCPVFGASDFDNAPSSDGILLICQQLETAKSSGLPSALFAPIEDQAGVDEALHSEGAVLKTQLPQKRLVYAPTGPLNPDFDDVRSFAETGAKAVKRALKAGIKFPVLVLPPSSPDYPECDLISLLGVLEALYVPLQLREEVKSRASKVQGLYVVHQDKNRLDYLLKVGIAMEQGRFVARDLGGGDPERMAPPKFAQHLVDLFEGSKNIKISVETDQKELEKKYPLFGAVNRAASVIERHQGRIVHLTYKGAGPIDKTLCLVGKGVTYDTGGADIKAGGVMAGMSRDKCGASAIAGFMQTLSVLAPKGIEVRAKLGVVRNSVGENCYVADEVITARSGVRVRIGNTDAEGRMAMCDLLTQFTEECVKEKLVNPHLMTVATLTGHACLSVGLGYSICMDNAVARKEGHARSLQSASEIIGDPFEISTIRREDYAFHRGKGEVEDVLQCNNKPSSQTARGHQGPAAFLLITSGLEKHGLGSNTPLKYSHLDIAASCGDLPHEPTGAPISAFTYYHLKNRF